MMPSISKGWAERRAIISTQYAGVLTKNSPLATAVLCVLSLMRAQLGEATPAVRFSGLARALDGLAGWLAASAAAVALSSASLAKRSARRRLVLAASASRGFSAAANWPLFFMYGS